MNVAVLLSTKNGAAFVHEQLTSISIQSHANTIYWRDDGSTDNTVDIVRRYLGTDPLGNDTLGITRSYRHLLKTAWDDGCNFFAFADQDDVWAIDKIERGIAAFKTSEPTLYCARQTYVDVNLHAIGGSPQFRDPIGFPAALTQNIAAGCTIILNRSAAELVLKTLDQQKYHDWWCYIIVAAYGGHIVVDNAKVIQYRQHANNTIGAPTSYLRRFTGAIKRGQHAFMSVFRDHVSELQKHTDLLPLQSKNDLNIIARALAAGFITRWNTLQQLSRFHRQTLSEDVLFRVWFLIG